MRAQQRITDNRPGEDDILSVVLEAVVYLVTGVSRAVWWILVQIVRLPSLALGAAAVAGAGLQFGWAGVYATVAVLFGGLLSWRLGAPVSFNRWAQPHLLTVARTAEHRARWPRVARRAGLVVHDWSNDRVSRPEAVRLVRVQVSSSGVERLHLRLPVGLSPGDVVDKVDAIAHALKSRDAKVCTDRPGRVILELRRKDTLAPVVAPLPVPETLDLAAVPVGRSEDGDPWCIRLAGTHLLLAGATGSGKSSVLWSLLRALSVGVRDRLVEVWAVDPKGGMELRPGRHLFRRFEDSSPEDMCALLEDLVEVKDQRARELASTGDRVHKARHGSRHIVVLLDELATLTAFADRSITRRIDLALGLLLTQGRACGITVVAAVQDPGKDIVGWRDLFPTRIALRLDNPIQVAMVLGDGAREMGAKADEISELTPGVAYVRVEGTRAIRRVRAAYLDDTEITALTRGVQAPAQQRDADTTVAPNLHVVPGGETA